MSYDFTYKLLMLGDTSVGKTALTHHYITGLYTNNAKNTIGIDFFSKKIKLVNGKRAKLQILDFGGENRFRFLLPTYCDDSNAAIFFYDITSHKTLESISNWIEYVRKHAPEIVLILVGCKLDLANNRQVSLEEAQNLACKYAMAIHIEVSSKTGQNVAESFKLISELLLKESDRSIQLPLEPSPEPSSI